MNDLEESSTTVREVNEPLGRASEFEKCDRRQIFLFRFFFCKKNEQNEIKKAKVLGKISIKSTEVFFIN